MELIDKWCCLCEDLFCDFELNVEEYKKLFAETWKYFIEQNCESGIVTLKTAEILGYIKSFQSCPLCPGNVSSAEFETCRDFADGLFLSTVNPVSYDGKTLSYGWIVISKYLGMNSDIEIHIDNFIESFDMILKIKEEDNLV